MVAELEKIAFEDGGGFTAEYIYDTGGMWHFHPEYEIVLNIKGNGTRIIGDSVELFDHLDMVLIGGNIPHSWNYYISEKSMPDNHGIIVHFRQSSLGDALLSQHEMHSVRELLSGSDRGIGFSTEDAKSAEKYLTHMVNCRGIDKMIDFFNVVRIMCDAQKKVFLCSENYKRAYDERGNKKMAEVMGASEAAERYQRGISLIAGSDGAGYLNCGAKRLTGGVKAVAECMKGLKKSAGLSVWAEKYRAAYGG